jgi:hypothetical protein
VTRDEILLVGGAAQDGGVIVLAVGLSTTIPLPDLVPETVGP